MNFTLETLEKKARSSTLFGACLMLAISALPAAGNAAPPGPSPVPPYSITTFAANPPGLSAPDSITFNATNVFVGYGNGGDPSGLNGAMSNIVEYDLAGNVINNFQVVGHNDGLRINPSTGDLWALQNEDANANLAIIDLDSGRQKVFQLGTGPHGGGYDDIVFDGRSVFISASNPTSNPNTAPAISMLTVHGKNAEVTGVFSAGATATDVTTGETVTLNLQDPDSMILDPFGELLLDSQGDGELVVVQHPGTRCQNAFLVPLTSAAGGTTVGNTQFDDTVFATAPKGMLLVADKALGAVFAIQAPYFAPDAAYSAVSIFPTPTAPNSIEAFVGQTNLTTGFVTPIVNGMGNPGGMAFIPAGGVSNQQGRTFFDDDGDDCR